ncbi:cobalamin B12-binding domain-containing protein [Desulfospira joergensenii]|uniref:cobalamin B12-binding domain-containing protein n=1 Tax=Desulfospira joergensenii TaxID=53329 RepID=UPI0003B67944|nr:corrinoid protein [Desulfospira joergensenii]
MAEINEKITQLVIAGDGALLETMVHMALDTGGNAATILDQALLPAMDIVGQRMKTGEMFIPEVLLAAKTMEAGLKVLTPFLAEGEKSNAGTCVLGTVEGDLHDIGKNLVGMMLSGSGFKVIDLGINVTAADFGKAAVENNAGIVCMSALLTTTMPKMKQTIDHLTEAGLRETVKILVGGAPVTAEYAREIGADGYGFNAADAVEKAKEFAAG